MSRVFFMDRNLRLANLEPRTTLKTAVRFIIGRFAALAPNSPYGHLLGDSLKDVATAAEAPQPKMLEPPDPTEASAALPDNQPPPTV